MFIIQDWAGNRCSNIKFQTLEDAWDYIYNLVSDNDEYLQEYEVIDLSQETE